MYFFAVVGLYCWIFRVCWAIDRLSFVSALRRNFIYFYLVGLLLLCNISGCGRRLKLTVDCASCWSKSATLRYITKNLGWYNQEGRSKQRWSAMTTRSVE